MEKAGKTSAGKINTYFSHQFQAAFFQAAFGNYSKEKEEE
jgi:hypothetical protein